MADKHPFDVWWDSSENPLRGASDVAVHFAKPAMRAAYRAGGNWVIKELKGTSKERYDSAPFTF